MIHPRLPPLKPIDDVFFVQGFYWACVGGQLYGGYLVRGDAERRMRHEQQRAKCLSGCVFWQLGGNCTKCGREMPADQRARFQAMIDADTADTQAGVTGQQPNPEKD